MPQIADEADPRPKRKRKTFQQLASLRLEVVARLSRRHADADYRRKVGLGILQCRILGLVGSQGPMTFRSVCRESDLEKSQASRLVAGLIELGLFEKTSDPADHRSFVVGLTAAGRRTYDQVHRIAVARNERWLAVLTPEQREAFFACLSALSLEARKLAHQSRGISAPARLAPARASAASRKSEAGPRGRQSA